MLANFKPLELYKQDVEKPLMRIKQPKRTEKSILQLIKS